MPIYRADELRGVVFIVMAFVDGESLAERLAKRGTLAATELVSILRDVARALDHAHSHGIVHRDIKPENILIERLSGRAIVTDFGIARLAEAKPLTLTGQVLGTVHYMRPEQISGGTVDGRTDLYSLGVVGFRALTGRLPFERATAAAVLVAHVMTAPPKVRDVAPAAPGGLAAIIDRCLVKDPAGRLQSADELARAPDDALADVRLEPATASATRRPPPTMLSDREAQALWSRAAELQAVTGNHGRRDSGHRRRSVRCRSDPAAGLGSAQAKANGRDIWTTHARAAVTAVAGRAQRTPGSCQAWRGDAIDRRRDIQGGSSLSSNLRLELCNQLLRQWIRLSVDRRE